MFANLPAGEGPPNDSVESVARFSVISAARVNDVFTAQAAPENVMVLVALERNSNGSNPVAIVSINNEMWSNEAIKRLNFLSFKFGLMPKCSSVTSTRLRVLSNAFHIRELRDLQSINQAILYNHKLHNNEGRERIAIRNFHCQVRVAKTWGGAAIMHTGGMHPEFNKHVKPAGNGRRPANTYLPLLPVAHKDRMRVMSREVDFSHMNLRREVERATTRGRKERGRSMGNGPTPPKRPRRKKACWSAPP